MLWPKTVENRVALRTSITVLVAVLISFSLHLKSPYWSGITVVLLANLYTGNIIDKAMVRIVRTVAGALIGVYVVGIVANSFILYILFCFLIVSIGAYYYSFSVYGYAYLLGALCAFIVLSQLAINPQNAFFVAIWPPIEIAIGVLVAAIGAYYIFPNHLNDNVTTQLQDIFVDFAIEFDQLFATLMQENPNFDAVTESNLNVKRKIRKAVELIGALNHELGVTQERTDLIRALLDSFYDLVRQLQYLFLISPQHGDISFLHSLPLQQTFNAIKRDLNQLQYAFANEKLTGPLGLQTEEKIFELERQFDQKRSDYAEEHDFIYSFLHFLHQMSQSLGFMRSLLIRDIVVKKSKYHILRNQERLRMDPELIKRSIKAGLSVVLALGFWMMTNWPEGLNGIISSMVISVRRNLFEMKYVSIHRLIGCFLGGGVALTTLYVMAMDVYELIIVLFCFVWVFTYFMFKFPKYAYVGLQANIALILSLAQEGGSPLDFAPPLQRLGGIVIGIIACFIVGNLVWRSDVLTMLNCYLKRLYSYMAYNLRQVLLMPGNEKILHDLASLFWLSRGLFESLAEESHRPKKKNTITELRARFESLVMTQATISHILATIDCDKARDIARSFNYDLFAYEQNLLRCFEQHDVAGGLQLSHQFLTFLAEIGDKAEFSMVANEDLYMVFAYLNALNQLALHIH